MMWEVTVSNDIGYAVVIACILFFLYGLYKTCRVIRYNTRLKKTEKSARAIKKLLKKREWEWFSFNEIVNGTSVDHESVLDAVNYLLYSSDLEYTWDENQPLDLSFTDHQLLKSAKPVQKTIQYYRYRLSI